MTYLDKNDRLKNISRNTRVVLELGCGNRKRIPDAICIDFLDYVCVDVVGDVLEVLGDIPDSVIDEIYSSHFFEHVSDIPLLMNELARVLKLGGKLSTTVPHFSNPYFWSDSTHKSYFGLYSMSYFSRDGVFKRKVPNYECEIYFEIENVSLVFKSPPPFYGRFVIKKLFGYIFNINTYMKELYEEMFAYWFPCYEVSYILRRVAIRPTTGTCQPAVDTGDKN